MSKNKNTTSAKKTDGAPANAQAPDPTGPAPEGKASSSHVPAPGPVLSDHPSQQKALEGQWARARDVVRMLQAAKKESIAEHDRKIAEAQRAAGAIRSDLSALMTEIRKAGR